MNLGMYVGNYIDFYEQYPLSVISVATFPFRLAEHVMTGIESTRKIICEQSADT